MATGLLTRRVFAEITRHRLEDCVIFESFELIHWVLPTSGCCGFRLNGIRARKTLDLIRRSRAIADHLANTSGRIGFTFRAKILGHRFWTLSVWEDERALRAFVGRDSHLNAMDALQSYMADVAFFGGT